MSKRWVYWGLVLIWCGLIFNVTSSPAATSKNTSSIIKKETKASNQTVHQIDYIARKTTHVTLFGVLAILLLLAIGEQKGAPIFAWLLATVYGASDEIHQVFEHGRTPSVIDVGIDSLGAFIFLCLYFLAGKWLKLLR